ncbi:MAG: DinB family protein [Phycisphaeraceae bacterium]|nr:MAG: DinB family protein [Phycisphaeraceae bacterium]
MNPLRLYDYLTEARARVFDWIRPLSDEQYRTEHPIGLGSLARTLHHTMAAEAAYMRRINGLTDPFTRANLELDPDATTESALAFAELEARWRLQAERVMVDLEAAVGRAWLEPMACISEWDGRCVTYRASPADFFCQLVIHEIHHRAQVLHMLRRLGVTTDEIDYTALMLDFAETPD